jgi:hypothetical protein
MEDVFNTEPKKNSYEPQYVVSIHKVVEYPRAKKIEKEVSSFTGGKKIWINVNPNIHSKQLEEIQPQEIPDKPGYFDLKAKLDKHGKVMWTGLCQEAKIDPFGVLIDGVYYRSFATPVQPDDSDTIEWVVIKGPFDAATAKAVEKYSKKNFKYFTKQM